MKELIFKTPHNTYILSDAEIAVIHALCFYGPDADEMTKKADKVRMKLEEQFRMHDAIGNFTVWK